MKALLLAAGIGSRLRPVTDFLPKCLVPIQKKPLLAYWLENLFNHGIQEVIINTHYLSPLVEDFIASSPYSSQVTLIHEPKLLGTAGTLRHNHSLFKNEAFLVAHADNLTRFNVQAFLQAHQNKPADIAITMMTFETDAPETCGIVTLNEYNIITQFIEKPTTHYGCLANAAVYIMEPSVIKFLTTFNQVNIDLSTEVLPHYVGRMQAFHNTDYHRDIGNLKSLLLAEMEF